MIKNYKVLISLFIIASLISSCEMFESHPYDVHITGERNINKKNSKRITEACKDKEVIRFVFMGDTQRWYDETADFVNAINLRDDIDFVIHGGDISDFGATKEFIWQRDILNGLHVPYVVAIGNHDYLGNGEEAFRAIFGDPDFTFMAGKSKFVCLNTNALDNDYSRDIPNFSFIEETITQEENPYENSIVIMHVPPFDRIFNNNVNKVFEYYIHQYNNPLFCLHAHTHHWSIRDLFDDGVLYYGCDAIHERTYMIFTINPDNTYTYELVHF
ncbi:MAG: metallophosphoesterase [Bacteroidaceae bacterium]|nr:metallophosphoesterase [Bacteroidaceae bacterium]